jgi:hypothetical protein
MREWIKLYTEIANDRKMCQLTDRQFRVCINLFALAGFVDDGGILPPLDDMAFQLRMTEQDLLDDLQALTRANIVIEDHAVWMLAHWIERQSKPPSDSPEAILERVRKHRAKLRNASVTPLQNVTSDCNEQCNAVTTRERENRIDKMRREEKEPAATPPPPSPAPKSASVKAPKPTTEQQAMFGALAETCQLDPKLKAAMIGKTAKRLTDAGYKPAQVTAFLTWWQAHDWRAKDSPYPSLAQVEDKLQQAQLPTPPKEHRNNGQSSSPGYGLTSLPKGKAAREPTAEEVATLGPLLAESRRLVAAAVRERAAQEAASAG